ncbi:MAG: hypothetical protein WB919_03310, partial [Candidatus Sulfotelmatobacter sp.]
GEGVITIRYGVNTHNRLLLNGKFEAAQFTTNGIEHLSKECYRKADKLRQKNARNRDFSSVKENEIHGQPENILHWGTLFRDRSASTSPKSLDAPDNRRLPLRNTRVFAGEKFRRT